MAGEGQQTPEEIAAAEAAAKAAAEAEAQKNGGGNGDEKVEVSKAEIERLRKAEEENQNKSTALAEERRLRKEQEAELKAFKDAEAKKKEDELKSGGKYEEIITQKDSEIERLSKENETFKSFYDEAQSNMKSENEKLLGEIPESSKELVNEAIAGKDLAAQNKLLKGFAETFKKPDFGDKGKGGQRATEEEKEKADMEAAKKQGFKAFAGKVAADIFSKKA